MQLGPSDIELIELTRKGDVDAYALLHERHAGSATALARRMSRNPSDADDLVSEGFARVLGALQAGKGPDTAFRPYLLSTIRRLAYDRTSREQRESPTEDTLDSPAPIGADPVVDGFERDAAAAAFSSLPERWRLVLWHTEVEGQTPAEVADLLGMSPNAVAALAYRAREGLRQAFLAEHTPPATTSSKECKRTTSRLSAYVRGSLTAARERQVREHLDRCDDCRTAYLELASVNTAMPAIVAVAVLGSLGASYLAEAGGVLKVTGFATAGSVASPSPAPASGGGTPSGTAAVPKAAAAAVVFVGAAVAALIAVSGRGATPDPAEAAGTYRSPASTGPTLAAPSGPSTDGTADTVGDPVEATVESTNEVADPEPAERPAARGIAEPVETEAPPVEGPSAPTTAPPATTPPVTTPPITERPEPEAPASLQTELRSAGDLVTNRPGILVVGISNDSPTAATETTLEFSLDGAELRGTPSTGDSADAAASSAWTCTARSSSQLRCTVPSIVGNGHSTLFVSVSVPAEATTVTSVATVTASNDDDGPNASTSATMPTVTDGFGARFATIGRGAVVTAGNTLLTCAEADAACVSARAGGPGAADNGLLQMIEVDVDGDPSTSNSSSARLSIPSHAQIQSATLYWSADVTAGTRGSPASDLDQLGTSVLSAPNGARWSINAERVDRVGSRYQAIADVTALVAAGGGGDWTLGGIQVGTGENRYGAWSVVVVYRDANEPVRSMAVLDGFTQVSQTQSATFRVGGFLVPASGASSATVDAIAYEGDVAITGDRLLVGGAEVIDASNPAGNTFNSSASTLGEHRAGSNPDQVNLLGFDIDRFDIAPLLTAGATSVDVTFETSGDTYLPGVLAFAIEQ